MKGQEAKCPPNKKPKKKNVAKRHSPNKQEAKKKHGFTEHEFNALPHRTRQRTALVFCLAAQRITTAFCSIFPMEFLGIRLLHGWFFSQRPPSLEANNGAIQMLRRARDFSWKRSVGKKTHTHTQAPLPPRVRRPSVFTSDTFWAVFALCFRSAAISPYSIPAVLYF